MLDRTLPRSRFPLIYAGFYLIVASVIVRLFNRLSFNDAAFIAAGVTLFACVAAVRDTGKTPLSRHPIIYLAFQTALTAFLFLIEPEQDYISLLFLLLSFQSILLLRERAGLLWIAGLTLLTAGLFLVFYAPSDAIAFTFVYCAAYALFGLLAKAVVESDAARATSEGLLAELREKESQLRDLAVSEERNRLAREIHDTLAQGLTGIVLQLEAAEQAIEESPKDAAPRLARAKDLARESLQEARRSVWNLLPRALEERSVEEALRDEVRRFAAEGQEQTSFDVRGERLHLTPEVQRTLLRVCQESLTNVRKHASATEVSVTLSYEPDWVRLQVLDNGIGIDMSSGHCNGSGRGLAGMDERARLIQGRFIAEKAGLAGTRVSLEIPLMPGEAE
jgi:signal transduction histidine kinase